MKTSFIKIDTLNIAYLEKNSDASFTIFFIHGNSVSKNCWRKQYNSDLFDNYRLIAFDLPGSGESDKSSNPSTDYTLTGLANISAKIITALANGKPYIIAGLSLGTNITAELLPAVEPLGIIMAAPCILGASAALENLAKPNTHVGVVFIEEAGREEVLLYAKEGSLSSFQEDTDIFIESYYATDKELRKTLGASIAAGEYSDEICILQQQQLTCLMIFGKDEKVVYTNYLDNVSLPLWNNKIYLIEEASHLVNIDQPAKFNQLVAEFAAGCFK